MAKGFPHGCLNMPNGFRVIAGPGLSKISSTFAFRWCLSHFCLENQLIEVKTPIWVSHDTFIEDATTLYLLHLLAL